MPIIPDGLSVVFKNRERVLPKIKKTSYMRSCPCLVSIDAAEASMILILIEFYEETAGDKNKKKNPLRELEEKLKTVIKITGNKHKPLNPIRP